jgi:pimeloyl-ACP methyl ester carboxylesterase
MDKMQIMSEVARRRSGAIPHLTFERGYAMPYFVSEDETELYYYDWGTGDPVVLIHGWPLTSASWEYQANTLANSGCRVIAYDRRGFGRSDWPDAGYDYDTLASDLNSLLEELDLTGVTLVGFSMGGGEVARYLTNYGSDRISKAVLIAAVTPFLLKTGDNPEGVDADVFDGMIEGLTKDRAAFLKEFWLKFYGRTLVKHTVSEAFLEFNSAMAMTGSPRATVELVRAWSETDFREDLKGITVPTLVIHGTGDSTVPIEVSGRRAAALIPNADLLEYEGGPHGLTATIPDQLNADLLEFIKR